MYVRTYVRHKEEEKKRTHQADAVKTKMRRGNQRRPKSKQRRMTKKQARTEKGPPEGITPCEKLGGDKDGGESEQDNASTISDKKNGKTRKTAQKYRGDRDSRQKPIRPRKERPYDTEKERDGNAQIAAKTSTSRKKEDQHRM